MRLEPTNILFGRYIIHVRGWHLHWHFHSRKILEMTVKMICRAMLVASKHPSPLAGMPANHERVAPAYLARIISRIAGGYFLLFYFIISYVSAQLELELRVQSSNPKFGSAQINVVPAHRH